MNIASVKKIDCWIGTPVCFILSIFNAAGKIFFPDKSENHESKKLLFLEFSEIGSTILGYSAMKMAQAMYPNSQAYIWVLRRNKDIISFFDTFAHGNIITMRDNNILVLCIDVIKNLWRIRRERIDTVIDMELFLRFSSMLSYLSGARKRAGFYGFSFKMPYRGDLYTHKVNYNHYMHISNNFLALIKSLSVTSENPLLKEALTSRKLVLPTIKSDKNDECDMWSKLKAHNQEMSRTSRIVILHPGVGDAIPLRRWPPEYYLELIRRLSDDPSIFFVIVGVKSKSPNIKINEQLAAHPRVINFIGKTTVRELAGLFNISYLLLSHDSGMVHLASLANISIVALFGPESPVLYRPLNEKCIVIYKNFICSPCVSAYNYKNSPCRMNKCMQAISTEEVFQEIKKVMQ